MDVRIVSVVEYRIQELTSRRETGSTANLDKRSKQSTTRKFDLTVKSAQAPKRFTVLFRKQHSHVLCLHSASLSQGGMSVRGR